MSLLFDSVMTTADKYEKDERTANGMILDLKDTLKEVQRVIAVGPLVKGVKEGDMVKLDLTRYNRMRHEQVQKSREERFSEYDTTDQATIVCDIPNETVDDKTVLMLHERDIAFIVDEYDDKAPVDITLITNKIITV